MSVPVQIKLSFTFCALVFYFATVSSTSARALAHTDATSRSWMQAIGTLRVPGSRRVEGRSSHHVEDCSATLVAATQHQRADTIITAWHCLEHYSDLTKPITFSLRSQSGEIITVKAKRLADGGSMLADWAVLRLQQAHLFNEFTPISIHRGRANPTQPIIMAGYSREVVEEKIAASALTAPLIKEAGGTARPFNIDPDCNITQQHRNTTDTDCMAQKGASGGPVIQLNKSGKAYYCGIISEGDGEGFSTFVPVTRFRSTINQYLR
ncbi:MAG: hypothetical protein ACI9JM_003449 [Halioglobus sp.]|jgi:hypothetical protein